MYKIFECKGDKGYRVEVFMIDSKVKITIMNRNNSKKYTSENSSVESLINVMLGCDACLGELESFVTNIEDLEEIAAAFDCKRFIIKSLIN